MGKAIGKRSSLYIALELEINMSSPPAFGTRLLTPTHPLHLPVPDFMKSSLPPPPPQFCAYMYM